MPHRPADPSHRPTRGAADPDRARRGAAHRVRGQLRRRSAGCPRCGSDRQPLADRDTDRDAFSAYDHTAPARPDRARADCPVLRSWLRSRRRDVAARRARPGARRPDLDRDPRPLLPRCRCWARSRRPRGSGSACCTRGRPGRPFHSWSTVGARPGRIDGIAKVFPVDAALRLIPRTTATATGPRTTWRLRVTAANGTVLHDAAKPVSVALRGAASGTRFQLWSKPGTYDQYRGILRIRASASGPAVTVVNELKLETYLRGVVPAEMPSTWPTAALEGPGDRRPLLRRSPAPAGRLVLRRRRRPRARRSIAVRWASARQRTPIIAASAGVVLKSGSTIANTLFHSTGGGATESNENVFTSSSGAKVAGAVSYLRGSIRSSAGRVGLRQGRPVRDLGDEDRTRGNSCPPGSPPTRAPPSGR